MNDRKFSVRAEQVLRCAQAAAGELGHGYVGTEHLLLALCRQENSGALRLMAKLSVDVDNLTGTSDMKKVIDMKGNPLLLFVNAWSVGMVLDRNEGLVLAEFGTN